MIGWSIDFPPSEFLATHRRYIQKSSSRAYSNDRGSSSRVQCDRGLGQRAGRRRHVVDQPDSLWEVPPAARPNCTANVVASLLPIEARLAWGVSRAAKRYGVKGNLEFSGQRSRDLCSRVEAAQSKSARMQWHGHDQVRSRPRRQDRGLAQHRPDHRCGRGIEPPQSLLRVFETVDPLGTSAVESDRGDAGRQWGIQLRAARAKVAVALRRHLLAQPAQLTRAGRNPFELTVAGRTKDSRRIRAGATGSAGRRKHQFERAPREFCEFAKDLGAVSLRPQGVVLHGTKWGVGAQESSTIRLRPVISSGCGRRMRSRTVGARSARSPSRSRRPTASFATQRMGTRLVV